MRCLIIVLSLLGAASAMAAPLSAGDRYEIEQRQKQLLENNQQQLDSLRRQSELPSVINKPSVSSANQPCFNIHHITWTGSTLLSDELKDKLSVPYLGQCLSLERINLLLRDINQWYMEQGYITSRAFVPEQDLAQGDLHIAVMEGKVERVVINGKPDPILRTLFPGVVGKPLNLRDIEQGLDQLQRLRSFRFQIDIQPGTSPGFSIINLKGQRLLPWQGGIEYDNSGQKSTGEQQGRINVVADSPFKLAELWRLSGAKSIEGVDAHDSSSLQAGLNLPYGYWNLDYGYSYSDYRNDIASREYVYTSEGDNQTHGMTLSRVMYRDGTVKSSALWAVNYRTNHNYIADQLLTTSSYKFSSTSLSLNHGFKWGPGFATFNPGLTLGTDWFGTKNDHAGGADELKAQFQKWTLFTSYGGAFTEQFSWLSSLYGQWSPDRLYSVEKLSLGGESSIRGFKEQSVSGDCGGYWRNELSWQGAELPVVGSLRWWGALDTGRVRLDDNGNDRADLIGSALGVEQQGRWVTSSLSVGFPLMSPGWMNADSYSIYYRLGLTL
jgi:Hemolysin activation/secretion protein